MLYVYALLVKFQRKTFLFFLFLQTLLTEEKNSFIIKKTLTSPITPMPRDTIHWGFSFLFFFICMTKSRKINEGFVCLNCGESVSPVEKTCRNHCPYCLHSLHVDGDTPGDRSSECHSLMEPFSVEKTGKGYTITHRCLKCKKIQKNKVADDDSWEKIIELSV